MTAFSRRSDPRLLTAVALIGAGLVVFLALVITDGRGQGQPAGRRSEPAFVPITAPAELRAAGRRATALVAYRWQRLGYRLVFAPGRRDVRAQTDRDTRTITVFLVKNDAPHRVAHDIAHELGHAVDSRFLTPAHRRVYLRLRGTPAAAWWPGRHRSDYQTGAGDFAEVFALCHAASPEFRSTLAARPSNPCALLAAVGVSRMGRG